MLGNEAIARGLYEAGCRFVSSYPGTPSTEITEFAAKYDEIYAEWAPNEKVALEAALGAAIGGARSLCAMKHVGMNVAADPMFSASYIGVNAGMIIAVADDPGMHSSQNEQDTRHYAVAAKLPMLEPADSTECLEFTKLAYEISEKYDTPVILRTCTRVAHSQNPVELSPRVEPALKPYEKNPVKNLLAPANAVGRHVVVEKRTAELRELAEGISVNRVEMGDTRLGFIASGTCYQYVKEVFPNASVLKLGMVNPLPEKLIRDFASRVDALYVIEEEDPVIETHVRALGVAVAGGKDRTGLLGELSQHKLRKAMGLSLPESVSFDEPVPPRPPVMCAGCPHRGLFYVLKKLNLTVFGDIGCYTLGSAQPLCAVDTTICMGASISGLHGFNLARQGEYTGKAVAVIGDSTFLHSGITGLIDIAYNGSNSTVLVLDNSITGMTGHQQNPATGLTLKEQPSPAIRIEDLCRASGIARVRVVDPQDMAATEQAIKEELAVNEPSVIISRRPCAMLKYVKPKPALAVAQDKCRGCRMCMRLGCPAIVFENGKARIDATLCVGCGLCGQMCKFGAIGKGDE